MFKPAICHCTFLPPVAVLEDLYCSRCSPHYQPEIWPPRQVQNRQICPRMIYILNDLILFISVLCFTIGNKKRPLWWRTENCLPYRHSCIKILDSTANNNQDVRKGAGDVRITNLNISFLETRLSKVIVLSLSEGYVRATKSWIILQLSS